MGIFVSSQADLAAMVSVASGVTFAASDLIFGTPRAATSAEITQYGKNTAVPVAASPSATQAAGISLLFYDRLDLKPLENFDLTSCLCVDGIPLSEWLPVVSGYLNIPFTISHFVEHSSVNVNDKVNVLLEAKASSLGWLGSVTLKFGGYPNMSSAFTGDKLPGF